MAGARHNAVRAISPATSKMLLKTVRDTSTGPEIHLAAIHCSALAISTLHTTSTEIRQLEVSVVAQLYQQVLVSLSTKPDVCLASLVEGVSLLTRVLATPQPALLAEQLARAGLLHCLVTVLLSCSLQPVQRRSLLPVIVDRVALLLRHMSTSIQEYRQ